MRLLIWHKLFIAMLAATTVVVIVTLLLTRWSFNRGFLDYINSIEARRIESIAVELADIYGETGSWITLLNDRDRWRIIMQRYSPVSRAGIELRPPPPQGRPPDRVPGERVVKRDGKSGRGPPLPPSGPPGVRLPIDLLDIDRNVLVGRPDEPGGTLLKPIEVDGAVVGFLRYLPASTMTDLDEEAERQFVEQQRAGLFGTALVALVIAAALAFLFGRRLVAPIRDLVRGTQALAAGQLDQRITVTSRDELGELAEDFNSMAASLQQSRRTQQRWVVDISHELRTPLAILTGELQALEDGIRDWSPSTRESLQAEADRLTSLVDDLREVSLSDAGGLGYQWRAVDLVTVIENALNSYATRMDDFGLSVQRILPADEVPVRGDSRRLQQLIINLLENSCSYTEPGGLVRVTCSVDHAVNLLIEDTPPGVPAEALPHLFDRLYRVEQSRNRGHGGSGLGLAICKGIVEAHGGQIHAKLSPLGGLAVEVELPRDHA